jgi:uncharacterized protein (TIGR02284 family)
MAPSNWIGSIERLIETCKDGESGYRQAAQDVRDPELQRFLEEQSNIRARFAQELRDELSRMTGWRSHGSAAGVMHRRLMDLLTRFGANERMLMNSVEQAERMALDSYRAALGSPMPPQFENMLRCQAESIRRALQKAMAWREGRAA